MTLVLHQACLPLGAAAAAVATHLIAGVQTPRSGQYWYPDGQHRYPGSPRIRPRPVFFPPPIFFFLSVFFLGCRRPETMLDVMPDLIAGINIPMAALPVVRTRALPQFFGCWLLC